MFQSQIVNMKDFKNEFHDIRLFLDPLSPNISSNDIILLENKPNKFYQKCYDMSIGDSITFNYKFICYNNCLNLPLSAKIFHITNITEFSKFLPREINVCIEKLMLGHIL